MKVKDKMYLCGPQSRYWSGGRRKNTLFGTARNRTIFIQPIT